MRKVWQDNGKSEGEINEKNYLDIKYNNIYCCYFIRSGLFATR